MQSGFGATGRTWTGGLLITNQLLYRLSHSSSYRIIISVSSSVVNFFSWGERLKFPGKLWFDTWQTKENKVIYTGWLQMRSLWRSRVAGRARTIGNRVYPKRVSRVQIPPSPPIKMTTQRVVIFIGMGIQKEGFEWWLQRGRVAIFSINGIIF